MQYQSQPPFESSKLVYTGHAWCRSLIITNVSASVRYLWVFDALTATGMILCNPIAILPTDTISLDLDPKLIEFQTGLFVASSTTQAAFAQAGGNDFSINAVVDALLMAVRDPERMA